MYLMAGRPGQQSRRQAIKTPVKAAPSALKPRRRYLSEERVVDNRGTRKIPHQTQLGQLLASTVHHKHLLKKEIIGNVDDATILCLQHSKH